MHWDSLSPQGTREIGGVGLNAKYSCGFLTKRKTWWKENTFKVQKIQLLGQLVPVR